jgi:hypothetical protein
MQDSPWSLLLSCFAWKKAGYVGNSSTLRRPRKKSVSGENIFEFGAKNISFW